MSAATVTIVGAGPVGTLMALLLAARGRRVRLLERRADPRRAAPERGRSINLALAARGIAALEQAGLMGRVAPQLVALRGRLLHEADGSRSFLRYGSAEHEVLQSMSREQLARTLIEAAAEQPLIELHFERRCIDVDPQAGRLSLRDERDGSEHAQPFELLLAADGAGSAVRDALVRRGASRVREELLPHDYKELAIAPLPCAAGEPRYALEPHALHIWPRGGFMLIALPNVDGSFTATLFLARHGEPGFQALADPGAVRGFFREHFPDALALIPDLETQFALHPQGRIGTVYCEGWSAAGRVLLLGDAAHAIVPFHGQGLNCGFEDCALLDRLLAAQGDAAALTSFEALRRPDTDALAAMSLENYVEMRDAVRAADFAARRDLAARLERRFPGRFVPRYSMVMFHPEIPYAEAQRRGARQGRLLDALAARCGAGPLDAAAEALAGRLLDEYAL